MYLLSHNHWLDDLSQDFSRAFGIAVRVEALALLVGNFVRTDVINAIFGDDTQVNVTAGSLQAIPTVSSNGRGKDNTHKTTVARPTLPLMGLSYQVVEDTSGNSVAH
jgi:hypothetical protein